MEISEAATEYPDLNLHELARQIKVFLTPYSFVESVYLYHGANKAKYHIIFKVPAVPEGWDKIQEVPQEPKSNAEKLKDFFKIETPVEVSTAPKTEAEICAEFYKIIEGPIVFSPLLLDEIYRRDKASSKPLGSPGYYDWPGEEWGWSIADGNNKILTGFYPVTSLGYKGDVKDLGLRDLVQPGEPVVLYEWPVGEMISDEAEVVSKLIDKRKGIEDEIRMLEKSTPKTPRESLDKARSLKTAQQRLRSLTEPKRLSQRHKLKVRKIAEKLWQTNPDWTIQKMIESDAINAATTPHVYAVRTLRDWIKDLAPNRHPGRRATKP